MNSSVDLSARASTPELSPITIAERGREIEGLDIFKNTTDDITAERVEELMAKMNADEPKGGLDLVYGKKEAQHLRLWEAKISSRHAKSPIVVFVHGGSWKSGTYLDSTGTAKVDHLTSLGYAFASVNYTLIHKVMVEEQVQEVADSVGYLAENAAKLGIDPERVILMGHSSGAHVVTLLGTDSSYLRQAGFSLHNLKGVISLDGSNYNALAEITDSPGPVANSLIEALGTDTRRLRAMSPTYNAAGLNAAAFLLLHARRYGDIRQAVELSAALEAAGTDVDLHVFEGSSFEGHMAMLLRTGDPSYLATSVMDEWLRKYVPVTHKE
ncbi:hypothetical protein FSARC_4066 [Fusarium sarcochroum]|uniref:BD-FAE-like domain-containing protein n=1 Tax=Fusarium sarcochroum TaxID=1208366 RepID=A0A8H4XBW2_9HYPO|nr:hypothetical protein FSARC_4066 [Fusarium sarcochroum]